MKKSTVIVRWGIITAIVMSLFSYLMYVTGASFSNPSVSYFGYVIMIGGMIMAMRQFRDKVNGGYASFGDQYKIGILMVLIISVITTIYFLIFMQLSPDFISKMIEQSQANMVNKGMSSEQIEMAMKYTKMFMTPAMMMIFSLIGNIIIGAIVGLLAAAITSKPKPFMEDNNTPIA